MLRHYDGTFDPDGTVTRAELAYFLTRAMGLAEFASDRPFSDVKPDDWFAASVSALFQNRLVRGTGPTTFSPERTVTRQEATTLVMRAVAATRRDDPATATAQKLTDQQAQTLARRLPRPSAHRVGRRSSSGGRVPPGNPGLPSRWLVLSRGQLDPGRDGGDALPGVPAAYRGEDRLSRPNLAAVPEYASLSVGSEGTLVSFFETRLTALRYPCGPVDGVYDYRTRDAVMAFQKVERLKRTGTVTAQVWERLATAGIPAPNRSGSGDRCEVDLTRQVLFMVSGDEVTKVVHVSTGALGTRTGHFSIGAKYEGWVECVTLVGKMYYPSYVVSKTAIHGYRERASLSRESRLHSRPGVDGCGPLPGAALGHGGRHLSVVCPFAGGAMKQHRTLAIALLVAAAVVVLCCAACRTEVKIPTGTMATRSA